MWGRERIGRMPPKIAFSPKYFWRMLPTMHPTPLKRKVTPKTKQGGLRLPPLPPLSRPLLPLSTVFNEGDRGKKGGGGWGGNDGGEGGVGGREAGEREIRSLNMHPFRPPPLPHFPHTHTHTGEEKGLCRRWWLSTYRKRGAVAYSTKDQQSSVRGYGKGKLRFVGETLMSGVTPPGASDPSKRRNLVLLRT